MVKVDSEVRREAGHQGTGDGVWLSIAIFVRGEETTVSIVLLF